MLSLDTTAKGPILDRDGSRCDGLEGFPRRVEAPARWSDGTSFAIRERKRKSTIAASGSQPRDRAEPLATQ